MSHSNVNPPRPTHHHKGIWQSIHAATYEEQDSPSFKPSRSPYLNVNPEHRNQNIQLQELLNSSPASCYKPHSAHSTARDTAGSWPVPSCMGGRVLAVPAFKAFTHLKWYAIHKTICFITEYIILMRIKSFCMHILPIHFKRPKFLTSKIDKFIRQKIINYFGWEKKNLAQHFACRLVSTYTVYVCGECVCVESFHRGNGVRSSRFPTIT